MSKATQTATATKQVIARARYIALCKALHGQDIELSQLDDVKVKQTTGYPDKRRFGISICSAVERSQYVKRVRQGVYSFKDDVLDEAGYVRTAKGVVPKEPVAKTEPKAKKELVAKPEPVAKKEPPAEMQPEVARNGFDRTRAFMGLCCLLNGAPVNVAEITERIAKDLGWGSAASCRGSVRYYSKKGTFVGPAQNGSDLIFPWREEFCAQALKDYKAEGLKPEPVVGGNGQSAKVEVVTPAAATLLSAKEELRQLNEQEQQLAESQEQLKAKRQLVLDRLETETLDALKVYAQLVCNGELRAALARLDAKVASQS